MGLFSKIEVFQSLSLWTSLGQRVLEYKRKLTKKEGGTQIEKCFTDYLCEWLLN